MTEDHLDISHIDHKVIRVIRVIRVITWKVGIRSNPRGGVDVYPITLIILIILITQITPDYPP